ncbi:Clp protease ClpP [Staphylococcus epidermidis]|nr:Clp protease ClpP [Staphylococcus epidermidis]
MKNRLAKLYTDNRKAQARKFEVVAKDDSRMWKSSFMTTSSPVRMRQWWGHRPRSLVKAVRNVDSEATIHLRVNCPGGSVFAARAMEQALRDHKGPVIGYVDGIAASAATFILAGGCGAVIMASGAMFMIHKAWTFAGAMQTTCAKKPTCWTKSTAPWRHLCRQNG